MTPPSSSFLGSLIKRRWIRFSVVGAIGFAVDALILGSLCHGFGFDPVFARSISFGIAVLTTWLLNRNLTFDSRAARQPHWEFSRYLGVNILTLTVNFGAFTLFVTAIPQLHAQPLIALVPTAILVAAMNYVFMSTFVFNSTESK